LIPASLFLLLALSVPAGANPLPALAAETAAREAAITGLKKDNQARFEFYSLRSPEPTKLAFLYLHGFSASPRESSPLAENVALDFRANAYFPRLPGHGIAGPDGLKGITLEDWEAETRSALRIARKLGEKVVVISMSTGSSLAIPAIIEDSEAVAAHVLISPNFRLYRWDSYLPLLPFGKWLARLFLGEYHIWQAQNAEQEFYWTTRYPSAAAVEAVRAARKAENANLSAHGVPTYFIYSPNDTVVHVPAILSAFEKIGATRKEILALPEAEGTHNITGEILAPNTTKLLRRKIGAFLRSL
jgi:alpha-beta hydrolase superfamily lysophospholipase